ncbi:MAG: hypothetical protein K0U29_05615 [Gammaproteobacteria bacterium]|nr:hypothetical protein [Gammaproteobacteria bacterium]MCH9744395.1 hypothetical protein [Gammaproteobacteria bacterium]
MEQKLWRARLTVCSIMLIMALIGLILLDTRANGYWIYSQVMAVVYALLSIWLFYYLSKNDRESYPATIWHQLLHWLGFFGILYLLNLFVRTGLLDAAQTGIISLTLLAFCTFLSGVYTDASFMFIGIALACLAGVAVLLSSYLTVLMIPTLLVVAVIVYIIIHRDRKKQQRMESECTAQNEV